MSAISGLRRSSASCNRSRNAVSVFRTATAIGKVKATSGRVLYIAADRPAQAARSLARMVGESDRAVLEKQLIVWKGPLPFDIVTDPRALLRFVQTFEGVTDVFIDGLKDVVIGLSDDRVGAAYNQSRQLLLAADYQLVEQHHQRKEQRGNGAGKPVKLADVYGSRWLTAGAGSVVLLWGEPGDPVVDFIHLKQPAEEVGPLKVRIDHERGELAVHDRVDLLAALRSATSKGDSAPGLTATDGARLIFDSDRPTDAQIEKARRRFKGLVKRGVTRVLTGADDDNILVMLPFPFRYWANDLRMGAMVNVDSNGYIAMDGMDIHQPFHSCIPVHTFTLTFGLQFGLQIWTLLYSE